MTNPREHYFPSAMYVFLMLTIPFLGRSAFASPTKIASFLFEAHIPVQQQK